LPDRGAFEKRQNDCSSHTNSHSGTGLMRAVWSRDTLKRNTRRDWLFAPGDARAMRQAVRLRAVPMLARLGIGD